MHRSVALLPLALLLLVLPGACGDDGLDTGDDDGRSRPVLQCRNDGECSLGKRCSAGACVSCDAAEIPYNGTDDDCDPATRDRDVDGDGDVAADAEEEPGTDCDDDDPLRAGTLTEACDDGIDNDCDEVVDCPDLAPPTVTFLSPADGAFVGDGFLAAVEAADDQLVASVSFEIDGAPLVTLQQPPFETQVSIVGLAAGPHTLRAIVLDGVGNPAEASVGFTIDRTPPTIAWAAPQDGVRLEQDVPASLTVADEGGGVTVEILADGLVPIQTLRGPSYDFTLIAADVPEGDRRLVARATDPAGNSAEATLHVTRATTGLSVVQPLFGAYVRGEFVAIWDVDTSNQQVEALEVRVGNDPAVYATVVSAPWSARVDTLSLGLADGPLALRARLLLVDGTEKHALTWVFVDNTAPTLELRAPTAGTIVTGSYEFAFDATDAGGVAFVRARLGEGLELDATDAGDGRWTLQVDSRHLIDGETPLAVTAEDRLGNRTVGSWTVAIDNPGAGLAILSPADGSAQLAAATFVVQVFDPLSVRGLTAELTDGLETAVLEPTREIAGAGVYEFPVDLDFFAPGPLTFTARGLGGDGREDVERITVRNVAAPHFFTAPLQPFEGRGELRVGELIGRRGQPNDTRPDVVVFGRGGIEIHAGDGVGGFEVGGRQIVADEVSDVQLGDMDGDGALDVVYRDPAGVKVLANRGAGNFVQTHEVALRLLVAFAIGDFNGDDHLDVVLTSGSDLEFHLGDGVGGLLAPLPATGPTPGIEQLVVGDLTGDGLPDVVAMRDDYVSVYPNATTGPDVALFRFGAPINSETRQETPNGPVLVDNESLALVDWDHDGLLDVACGDPRTALRIYLNEGQPGLGVAGGSLAPSPVQYASTGALGCSSVRAIQIDGDGRDDLVCLQKDEDLFLAIANLAGGPEFRGYSLSPGLLDVEVANVNADVWTDVIAIAADGLYALPGNGRNRWSAAPRLLPIGRISIFAPGDFLLDDGLDFVAGNIFLNGCDWEGMASEGQRSYGQPIVGGSLTTSEAPCTPQGVGAGDFDGDGDRDIVGSQPDLLSTFVNDGAGNFAMLDFFVRERVGNESWDWGTLATGDFDEDGFDDIVVELEGDMDRVEVWFGDPSGSMGRQVELTSGFFDIISIRVLDMDGNGSLDIAHVNAASDDVTVHLNFGGVFVRRTYAAALDSYDVALGLLDGDGRGDLVVAADGGIAYLRGDAVTGGFTAAEFVPVEGSLPLTGVATGDFNGDGLDDVAGVSEREGRATFLVNDAIVSFVPGASFGAGADSRTVFATDLDGDGYDDLAVMNYRGGITLFFNDVGRRGCRLFEIPYNGEDDDCGLLTGEDLQPDDDLDGDGHGWSGNGFANPRGGDCDDLDASVRPGAPDPAGDGVDSDCDGIDG